VIDVTHHAAQSFHVTPQAKVVGQH
jgi:hypothetical protein